LAVIICVLSILSVFVMPRNVIQSGSRVKPVNEVQTVTGTEFATPAAAPAAEEAPAAEAADEAPVEAPAAEAPAAN
ncbi:MAG: hypothetical protein K2L62_06375, partial [Muribaculaceae bacterium]|nr:hypothetical protein [Muribaculaceae bacterium]